VREQTIAAIYPTIATIVGEAMFAALAQEHAAWTSPSSGDLNDYGERFADFIAEHPHACALPYLVDVAHLEWAVHRARRAAGGPTMDLPALAAALSASTFDVDRARLILHPAVVVVKANTPLASIWDRHLDAQQDQDDEPWALNWSVAEPVLVTRPADSVAVYAISHAEVALVAACAEGQALPSALACALATDASFNVTATLLRLATFGAIMSVAAHASGG
jgi:hypothetical protein